MIDTHCGDTTNIFAECAQGNSKALDDLIRRIYDQVLNMARNMLRHERAGHSLDANDVAQATLMRLLANSRMSRVKNRAMLFASVARTMRWVLIDDARRRQRWLHTGVDHASRPRQRRTGDTTQEVD